MVPSKLISENGVTHSGVIGLAGPWTWYIVGFGSVFGDSGVPSQWYFAAVPTPPGALGVYHFVVE